MRSNFKHGWRPFNVVRTVPEARVEEARVVNPKLAVRGIERHHLGCELGRNAHSLFGRKNVKIPGLENQTLTFILMTNLPELLGRIIINPVQFNRRSIALRLIGNNLAFRAFQIDRDSQTTLDSRFAGAVFVITQRLFPVEASVALSLDRGLPCTNRNWLSL